MAAKKILDLRQQIDSDIAGYKLAEAKKSLQSLAVDSVPVELRHDFARLARRAGLVQKSLKFLHNNVYEIRRPSERDVLEYASCIRKAGLINQCLMLLSRLPNSPDKLLYEAFCFIHRWEYAEAEGRLLHLLENFELNDKTKMIAKINLLACQIDLGQHDTAEVLLNEIAGQIPSGEQHLLLNLMELKGQLYFLKNDFEQSASILRQAQQIGQQENGTTNLFIQKWLLLCFCQLGRLAKESTELDEFRKAARALGHWESLRDFDWQTAKIFSDSSLANRVYFGSPFPRFKERIRQSRLGPLISSSYVLEDPRASRSAVSPGVVLDTFRMPNLDLPFGKGIHRLLMLMCSDLYQPWSVYRIHDSLEATEVFEPNSSAKKIYQLTARLSQTLSDGDLGLEFRSSERGYRLRPVGSTRLVIHDQMTFSSSEKFYVHCIEVIFGQKPFTAVDLAGFFPLETHQIYRLLTRLQATEELTLESSGKTKVFKLKAKIGD